MKAGEDVGGGVGRDEESTAHAVVSPSTTPEVLYVAATRGRESNSLYVDTTYDPDPATSHDGATSRQSAREVLAGVLAKPGSELSAHETLERAQRQTEDFTVLAAEYETLARTTQEQRWGALLDRSGLNPAQLEQLRRSEAYGPLLAALRDADARGLDVEGVLLKLVAVRSLEDADDPAAVLHGRVDRSVRAAGSRLRANTNLIAGLIPREVGVSDPDVARALDERADAMQRRAKELAEHAVLHGEAWVSGLGALPRDYANREQWLEARLGHCRLPRPLEHRRRPPTHRPRRRLKDDRRSWPP